MANLLRLGNKAVDLGACLAETIQDFLEMLIKARASVLTTMVLALVLTIAPQSEDVFVQMTEDTATFWASGHWIAVALYWPLFGLCALMCAFAIYYCARFALRHVIDDPRPPPKTWPRAPRKVWLNYAPGQVATSRQLWSWGKLASFVRLNDIHSRANRRFIYALFIPELLAMLFLVVTADTLFNATREGRETALLRAAGLFAVIAAFGFFPLHYTSLCIIWLGRSVKIIPTDIQRFNRLPHGSSIVLLLVALAILGLALLIAWCWPVDIGNWMGPASLLMTAGMVWLVVATIAVNFAEKRGFPLFTAITVIVLLLGERTTNHQIDVLPGTPKLLEWSRPFVQWREAATKRYDVDLKAWREARLADDPAGLARKQPASRPPLIIVATAGGGIRAAYWTTTVLGGLQEELAGDEKKFNEMLYAISGVSGGSLGAAVYRMLIAEAAKNDGSVDCEAAQALGPASIWTERSARAAKTLDTSSSAGRLYWDGIS
jgi:hypothetical protein